MIPRRFTSFSLFFLLLISACSQVDPGPSPVVEGPAIVDFSASPLNASGSATLSWRVNDATSLSIDQGVGDVMGQSSFTVTPQGTTTYTLTATNSEGANSARVTVTVSGTSPNPGPGNDTAAPTGSFGVSQDANPPFQNDSGDDIEGEGDSRIVRVAPGGTFYAQVAYEDASGITNIDVNLVNGSPGGVRGTLDPSQQFFTLGEATGTCDLSSSPVSVTCVYPITVAEDAVNIDELDGSGGEFAYVFRTQVTDAAGNTSDEAIRGYVIVTEETDAPEAPNNRAPSADFTSEQQENSLSVKFSAEASSDPDGDSLSYAWDFGDDSAGSSRDFTKTYREAKDYEVTLTVSDGQGGEATETKTVTVEPVQTTPGENTAPQVEIEEVDPITLTDDSVSVSLEATVTDSDSGTFTYTWNVTEGNAENVTLASRNEEDTDVSFSAVGSYTLTLTVSDGDKEGKGRVEVEVRASGGEPANPTCTSPVNIPDEDLESQVRIQLRKFEDDLTCEDLASLETLYADGEPIEDRSITNLEGLQFAVNLVFLDLSLNTITDLTPLTGLTDLQTLILSSNPIADLTPLANLTSLTSLSLGSNSIADLSPLANLNNLTSLSLADNGITDLSPLANLTSLTDLALDGNDITNVTPLANLTNLTDLNLGNNGITDIISLANNSGLGEGDSVDLRENNLETCPGTEDRRNIDALIERGVRVRFDQSENCDGGGGGDNANVITVTSTSGAASLEDDCTLRAAITAANTDQAVGGCPAGSGADTVVLAEGATYTLTEVDNGADETSGPSGLPRVTSEIEIEGNGATIERSDANAEPYFRLFYVAEAGNLRVQEVTVRKGGLVKPSSQEEPGVRGANFLNLGSLTVTSSDVREGYVEGEEVGGIAIHNLGTLMLENSTVSDNTSNEPYSDGSALYNAGEARVVESIFTSTREGSLIKAIYNAEPGTLEFRRSLVTGYKNFGIFAGIDNDGAARIIDSAIIDNFSDQDSAGISNGGTMEIRRSLIVDNGGYDGGGGGIGNSGTLTLINSTVSDNVSEFNSSSIIFNANGGMMDIRYSTIKDNFTEGDDLGSNDLPANTVRNEGTVTLHGAVLNNVGTTNCVGSGTFISEGYNLDGDGSCNLNQSTDLSNVEPKLGELEDNGGPTLTHALQEGSPAINAVPTSACEVDTDQRGVSRPQGEACDIGAFELE